MTFTSITKFALQNQQTQTKFGVQNQKYLEPLKGGRVKIIKTPQVKTDAQSTNFTSSITITIPFKYTITRTPSQSRPAFLGFLLILWPDIAMPFFVSLKPSHMPEIFPTDTYSQNTGIYVNQIQTLHITNTNEFILVLCFRSKLLQHGGFPFQGRKPRGLLLPSTHFISLNIMHYIYYINLTTWYRQIRKTTYLYTGDGFQW